MRVLLVAATAAEVQPLTARLGSPRPRTSFLTTFDRPRGTVEVLVTGVGMVATAIRCAATLTESRYDVALNAGVCGSFVEAFPAPTVVHVTADALPELGAEDGDAFLSLERLGLAGLQHPAVRDGWVINTAPPASATLATLPTVRGITVNTAHGHEPSIARVVASHHPDVESMEGAAFMQACAVAGVPYAQIRAVSNRVERRNRASWRLGEAVTRLTEVVAQVVDEL